MAELKSQFTASIKIGVAPLTVNFTNTSIGSFSSCMWDFGDGSQSTEFHPIHQFLTDGSYVVTLTCYSSGSEELSVSSQQTILVFADNQVDSEDSTEQSNLFTWKRFDVGQVNVVEQIQSGSTYTMDTLLDSNVIVSTYSATGIFNFDVDTSTMTGSGDRILTTHQRSISNHGIMNEWWDEYYDGTIDSGTSIIAIALLQSGSTTTANVGIGEMVQWFTGTTGIPQFAIYSIISMTRALDSGNLSTFTITVDRDLPWRGETSSSITGILPAWIILNTPSGTPGHKFDDESLKFVKMKFANDDMKIQTFANGVFNQNASANGVATKVGADSSDTLGHIKAIIYPDWSGVTTADALAPGTNYLYIPWIMDWRNPQTQLKLYDIAGEVQLDEISGQRFKYMRDGTLTSDNIFGRIYYDSKVVIIDDPEINIALQASSNRNFTLPDNKVSIIANTGGWVDSGVTYFITYSLDLNSVTTIGNDDTFGFGHSKVYPCMDYAVFTPSIEDSRISLMIPSSTWAVVDNTGDVGYIPLTATTYIYIATGTSETNIDVDSWRYSAYTPAGGVFDNTFELTEDYTAMTLCGWGTAASNLTRLGYSNHSPGDENVIFAHMSGNLETTTYKIAATCVAKNNEFNETQNETHVSGSTYITEVGIYNENNELLMVGKLNKPIEKSDQKYVVVKMELDL